MRVIQYQESPRAIQTQLPPKSYDLKVSTPDVDVPISSQVKKLTDIVSHSIRTPLHAILNTIESWPKDGEHQKKYLQEFSESLSSTVLFLQSLSATMSNKPSGITGKSEVSNTNSKLLPQELFTLLLTMKADLESSVTTMQASRELNSDSQVNAVLECINTKTTSINQNALKVSQYLNGFWDSQKPTVIEMVEKNNVESTITALIVDDIKTNQQILGRHLKKEKCLFKIANNGAEAVKLFVEQTFDIIFMDLSMPVMDGYEATRQIRELEKHKNLTSTPLFVSPPTDLNSIKKRF